MSALNPYTFKQDPLQNRYISDYDQPVAVETNNTWVKHLGVVYEYVGAADTLVLTNSDFSDVSLWAETTYINPVTFVA